MNENYLETPTSYGLHVGLFVSRDEVEHVLEGFVRFVKRYVPGARLVEVHTELELKEREDGFRPFYHLRDVLAIDADGNLTHLNRVLAEKATAGWSPPPEDGTGAFFWERALLEGDEGRGAMNVLLYPLVWAFAGALEYRPKVSINVEEPGRR